VKKKKGKEKGKKKEGRGWLVGNEADLSSLQKKKIKKGGKERRQKYGKDTGRNSLLLKYTPQKERERRGGGRGWGTTSRTGNSLFPGEKKTKKKKKLGGKGKGGVDGKGKAWKT